MKFKGIELKDNTEAELFIAIEIVNINNEEELKKYGKKLMKNIYNILEGCCRKLWRSFLVGAKNNFKENRNARL